MATLLKQDGGIDAAHIRDSCGGSPAHDAAENGHVTCLRLLLDAGLDPHLKDEVRVLCLHIKLLFT